jgi:hypothetical protein
LDQSPIDSLLLFAKKDVSPIGRYIAVARVKDYLLIANKGRDSIKHDRSATPRK